MTGLELARILLENPDKEVAYYSPGLGRNVVVYAAAYAEEVDQIIVV